ncbi:putative F-box/LRR-repeat protein At3g18150 [Corylus avellana]|uniref:putative F-box/LRR-repeat protein At3g18150 n=1 Tax=Corylus avellana TaxID=13451 RepID=UPI00286B0CB1|nr:putative F-box/LRR-repeat protein At3g18150 [Corylus avellana]
MQIDESYCALVNRWIEYAIESNVKELNLSNICPPKYSQVPKSVLVAKSITKLTLCFCNLKSLPNDINLSSLKKLVVGRVYMEDQNFQNLIAGCLVVEEIKFEHCKGLKNICVSGLPKLMVIELVNNFELESVEIEASNLKSLLANFVNPSPIFNLLPCENLKNLALYSANVTDKWLHDLLSKNPLIQSLDLNCCKMLKTINISSDRIQNLTFNRCRALIEVNIATPKLHRLKYFGNRKSFSSNTSTFSVVSSF